MAIKPFLGANLPRSHQAIILVLGLCLTGIWAWRAGLILPHSAPGSFPSQPIFIEARGYMPSPGFYRFFTPPTVQQVWEKAGGRGILPDGAVALNSGSKLHVTPDHVSAVSRMSGSDLLTLGLKIDPNQAGPADFEAIPGIGPVLGKRIVEFREEHGPFLKVEDLEGVKGLGPRKLEKMRQYLAIANVDPNQEELN